MRQCISQVQEVSRHRARSLVNRQMMRQQGQSEDKTVSSLEYARVSIGEEREQMEGKRCRQAKTQKHFCGDVPRCIRHNDDKSKSTAAQPHTREKEKGSSNEAEEKEMEEGGSKEVKKSKKKRKQRPEQQQHRKKESITRNGRRKKCQLRFVTKECEVVDIK